MKQQVHLGITLLTQRFSGGGEVFKLFCRDNDIEVTSWWDDASYLTFAALAPTTGIPDNAIAIHMGKAHYSVAELEEALAEYLQ